MVFQEFDQLFPWRTVSGNVLYRIESKRYLEKAKGRRKPNLIWTWSTWLILEKPTRINYPAV